MSKGGFLRFKTPQILETDCIDDCRSLKRELVRAQEEIKRIQSVPLVIGQFMEAIDQKYALTPTQNRFVTDKESQYWYRSKLDRLQLRRPRPFHTRP